MRSTTLAWLILYLSSAVLTAKLIVYDGKTGTIADGWRNFSWAKINLQDKTYVHPGDQFSASMVCAGWEGFYLSEVNLWSLADYNLFTFWINGGDDGGEIVTITLTSTNNSKTLSVADYILPNHEIPAKQWVQVTIPLGHFDLPALDGGQIKGFWFQANSKTGKSSVYFADIAFELGNVPPVVGPNLAIDATSQQVPIKPEIFGATIFWTADTQAAYEEFAQSVKLPLNRIGGDGTTRYNWKLDSSNSGADWYFMGGGTNANPTPSGSYDNFITINNKFQTKTVVTIPMIEYINKQSTWHCSFPKSVYGPQKEYNPYIHPNNDQCGNGVGLDGKNIVDKDPLATDIPNTPEFQKEWIQHLISKFGNSQKSGIIYQLDNEVSNWAYMHRDVHPQPVTYPEIINQTLIYAAAVKEADPTAYLAAPSEIQFAWYPDWGGLKNVVSFLQAMKAYEAKNGKRILDSFDVHYPDADDNHWPKLTDVARLKQVVDQTYPGTAISFSEWTMSGAGALGGALAVADQLGEYAKNSASFASIWGLSTTDIKGPLGFAFKIFRNYDGKGTMFGDRYISGTTSASDGDLSIHSALRSSDGAMTILVINKIAADQKSVLSLKGFNGASSASVFEYGANNEGAIVQKSNLSVSNSGFTTSYSAFSLTLIVINRA